MKRLIIAISLTILFAGLILAPSVEGSNHTGVGVEHIWPMFKDFNLVPVEDDFNFVFLNLTHMNGQNDIWRVYLEFFDSSGAITANFTFERMEIKSTSVQATNKFLEGEPTTNALDAGSAVDYWQSSPEPESVINLGLVFKFEPIEASAVRIRVIDINEVVSTINAPFPSEAGSVPFIDAPNFSVLIPLLAAGILVTGVATLRFKSNAASKLAEERIVK